MSKELEFLTKLYSVGNYTGIYFQDTDGLHLENAKWLASDYYTPINPSGHRYEYDIICSIDSGNMLNIGWERFDANKTSRSNNACRYVISARPTTDLKYKRYKGIIDLSTDGVNPTAFIKLRILNKWTNSDSDTTGKAIIHSISLREFGVDEIAETAQIKKNGQLMTDYFRETPLENASFSKNGFVDGGQLYEY